MSSTVLFGDSTIFSWSGLWLNTVAYVIIAMALIKVWMTEHKDIHCPNFNASPDQCEKEGGASYAGTQPEASDTCDTLLKKIYKAAGAEQATIKWRRSLLLASGIMFGLWFLLITPGRLPDFRVMLFSILLAYVILFASFNYYSYHVYGVAEEWTKRSVDQLREKRCV